MLTLSAQTSSQKLGDSMFSNKRAGVAALLTAASLVLGGTVMASPATATMISPMAVYAASGQINCPTGQKAYVSVTLNQQGTVTFFTTRGRIHQSTGNFHWYAYPNTQGGLLKWRVEADRPIGQVSDGCANA